jgi:nitrite reductase/ring-hydroxylating ferredoxin subunit
MMGTHDTSVTEMILMESRLLEDGEFRLSDVPAGTAMLLGEAAVFNVDGRFCATQNECTHRQASP